MFVSDESPKRVHSVLERSRNSLISITLLAARIASTGYAGSRGPPRLRGKEIRDRSSGSGAESGRISTSQRGSDRNPALFSILPNVPAGKLISCLGELEACALVR